MTAFLITGSGERKKLPVLLEWELEYGCGTPCDSFRIVCLWNGADHTLPAEAARFEAFHEGELVFTGVVDECEVSLSAQGCRLEVNGRGLAALLLDNEAQGRDYDLATIQDILDAHVRPYGIQVGALEQLPAVAQFSVAHGSSEWSVLYQFARYHGGVTPRFDRQGQLLLTHWPDAVSAVIHDWVPVTQLRVKNRRYGVLSEIWVREAGKAPWVQRIINEPFKAQGGSCRRMFTMPGKSNYQAMRYQGEYQLKKSEQDRLRLELDVALPFCAWPGEIIRLDRSGWGYNGLWRIAQSTVSMDSRGYCTHLELIPPDTML